MGKIASTVTIARPPADVYGFLLDLDKNHTDPTVESVTKSPEGPTAAGTSFHFTHSRGPKQTSMRYTSVTQDREIAFEGKVGPLRPLGTFRFEVAEGGTRLSVAVAANPVGPLKLLSPLVNRMGQRIWNERLEHIKSALESSPAQE